MIVEDDDGNRELFAQALTLEGMRVWLFRHAQEALGALATKRPDVVVTDLVLPGMDGARFARVLRGTDGCQDLPVIFVTGWPLTPEGLSALPEGTDVLMKPFLPERLVSRVRRAIARRQVPKGGSDRQTETRKQTAAAELLLKERNILLIEDDPPFRYALTRQLRHAGAHVIEAASLAQARDLLTHTKTVDAIVSDIVLPDGDAPDALRQLELERRVPVLYITAFPAERCAHYGLRPSDPQLLQKPFDESTLVTRIRALCA